MVRKHPRQKGACSSYKFLKIKTYGDVQKKAQVSSNSAHHTLPMHLNH